MQALRELYASILLLVMLLPGTSFLEFLQRRFAFNLGPASPNVPVVRRWIPQTLDSLDDVVNTIN